MWEEKSDSKNIASPPGQTKNLFGKCLRAFFWIINTFELDRKLATTVLFFNRYPKAIGNFSCVLCVARQISPDDVSTAEFCSQTWASAAAAAEALVCWGRLLKQGTCEQKGSYNQNSFDSRQGIFGLRAKFRFFWDSFNALLRAE